MQDTDNAHAWRRVEASRYALLRRVALAMRHQMVVPLQPLGMVTELLERRLKAGQHDLEQVRETTTRIHGFTRDTVEACKDAFQWMAPDAGRTVALDAGVRDCITLLRSSFSFRGFTLVDALPASVPHPVSQASLRMVLCGTLLALTDRTASPAEVRIEAMPGDETVTVRVAVQPSAGDAGLPGNAPYRLLDWDEVQVMAGADDVEVKRDGNAAELTFIVLSD